MKKVQGIFFLYTDSFSEIIIFLKKILTVFLHPVIFPFSYALVMLK